VQVIFNAVGVKPPSQEERSERRHAVRETLGLSNGESVLLFCAHNFYLKGLEPALRAFARLREGTPDARMLVIGSSMPNTFADLAKELGSDSSVMFLGPTSHMRDAYCSADVLVHPTYYDACSRVVLESLCVGLPVVTTAFNGAAEAVSVGKNGIVVEEPDDIDTLAGAIKKCLDPNFRKEAENLAPKSAETLDIGRHVEKLIKIYEQIAAEKKE
jgi:UDP-glucose:(heptosyl)LPS alpha-1,3-glucosyltransferase